MDVAVATMGRKRTTGWWTGRRIDQQSRLVVEFPRGAVAIGGKRKLRVSMRLIEELSNVSPLSPSAKMIYIATMMHQPASICALATKSQLDRKTVARHCRELEHLGWLRFLEEVGKHRPVAVLPPAIEAMLAMEVSRLLDMAHFKGEETTKVFEDWIVAPRVRLIYDSRPPFLTNPETGKNLEYDIFAPDWRWATEYQGDQHFSVTDLYPDKKQFQDRQKRDLLKVGLCKRNNIRLSIVTKNELSLERFLSLIPPDIPRRDFDPKGPFVQMLEKAGKEVAGRQDWDRE